jgi:hypothetical protein
VIEALRHGDRGQGPGDRRQTAPDGLNVDYPHPHESGGGWGRLPTQNLGAPEHIIGGTA